ncbi:MAG TPA: monodechloroaminopyrrolnitrin synthase PrnB family protein [Chryseosolibacter sp.]|nr:monodechloroaminopyrrolnitrin synthase PrnB family protein [Chryseosolibacter sp.]
MRYTHSALLSVGWHSDQERIASIDPLGFDDKIRLLHLLNKSADTHEIIQMLYRLLPVPDALDRYGYQESIAAMRDLGIFIGILKKHGIEPVEVIPELEYVLLVLMVKTDLPPRDTLLHYTLWNPDGHRMRTYTGLPDEKSLVESVKIAMPFLFESIYMLEHLHGGFLNGAGFEDQCRIIHEKMQHMVAGVVHAKRNVSPGVFANELRFYYDPIKVDYNKSYMGPGAVEMPMFIFDHLLWSCDTEDPVYTAFKEGYLPYNLRSMREIYVRFKGKQSLVTRVLRNLEVKPSGEAYRSACAVLELCTVLKSFRMPHKKLAESAYAHNDAEHRHHGSGGYSTDILQHIILLQNEKIQALKDAAARAKMMIETSEQSFE